MRVLLIATALMVLAGCQGVSSPGIALNEVKFAEAPVILQRGERFYLRYRCALADGEFKVRPVLVDKNSPEAAYYFFVGYTSFPEYGNLIERPLEFDGYSEFARRGQVYWLDPDGTKHPIPIRQEQ